MKTARSGSSPSPLTATSASKLRTWRPNALRRASMSIRPRWARSSTIRPGARAEHRPPGARRRRGSARSSPAASIPIVIVVLSPPGITSPSSSSSCSGRRTSTASAPSRSSASACASKSALDREHADAQRPPTLRRRWPRPTSHDAEAGSARPASLTSRPGIASPSAPDASAIACGSSKCVVACDDRARPQRRVLGLEDARARRTRPRRRAASSARRRPGWRCRRRRS